MWNEFLLMLTQDLSPIPTKVNQYLQQQSDLNFGQGVALKMSMIILQRAWISIISMSVVNRFDVDQSKDTEDEGCEKPESVRDETPHLHV
jgi:hypothetical protein